MQSQTPRPPKIALALSGSGPFGAIYEVHALCAQCGSFIENDDEPFEAFDPSWLLAPAFGEFARCALLLPGLFVSALWHLTAGRRSFVHALEQLGHALHTGRFSNEKINSEMTVCFRAMAAPTTSANSRPSTRGLPIWTAAKPCPLAVQAGNHTPISNAVQASSALPGLFLSVPFDATALVVVKVMRRGLYSEQHYTPRMVDGGLPGVLSQTFRSLIHSCMELGVAQYERKYPNTGIILIEPDHRDTEMYQANTFSYVQRCHLAEHAYQQTRQMLRSRKAGLSAKLWRHSITLHHGALDDRKRHLCAPLQVPTNVRQAILKLQEIKDDPDHVFATAAYKETNSW